MARQHLGPLALLAAIAVFATWPTVAVLGSAIPGEKSSDVYEHLWGYWWFFHEISNGRLPFRSELTHWPPGGVLWFVDPFGALLSVPLQAVTSTATAFSLLQILLVWGGMASGYALGVRATGERIPAMIGGIVYGASPYSLSLLHSGTTEYLQLAPIPLFWLALERVLDRGGTRPLLAAVATWAWATFASFYYAAFIGLLVPLAVFIRPRERWRECGERAAALLIGFGAAALPIVLAAWWTLHSPDAVVNVESAPGWSYVTLPATDLLTFLHPGDYYFPDNRLTGNFGIIHVNYLGWITVIAAAIGVWRAPEWRIPLLVAMVLALGPSLCFDGEAIRVGGVVVPLPMSLLYIPGSLFRFVHHPFRVIVLCMMFLGVAVSVALRGRPRLAVLTGGLILAETLTVSPAVWPLPTSDVTAPTWYAQARDDESVTGIWDFPPDFRGLNRRWEALQVVHGKTIPYGVNLFLPTRFKENHFVRKIVQCIRQLAVRAIPREGGPPLPGWTERPVSSRLADGRKLLDTWGFNRIVLHTAELREGEVACVLETVGGEVVYDAEGIKVIAIPDVPDEE